LVKPPLFAERADHRLVGTNLFSLFTISLIPFCTAYAAENEFTPFPTALYAGIMLLATFGYLLLQIVIKAQCDTDRRHRQKFFHTRDWLSGLAFLLAVPAPYLRPWMSFLLILTGVLLYFLPNTVTLRGNRA